MADARAFIVEEHHDGSPRWSAIVEIGDGTHEERAGDDPEELIRWARTKSSSVLVRKRVGGWLWAGDGDVPSDLLTSNRFEGLWRPNGT